MTLDHFRQLLEFLQITPAMTNTPGGAASVAIHRTVVLAIGRPVPPKGRRGARGPSSARTSVSP